MLSGLKREHFKSMKADVIQSGQILGLDGPTLSPRESISGLSELECGIRLGGRMDKCAKGHTGHRLTKVCYLSDEFM